MIEDQQIMNIIKSGDTIQFNSKIYIVKSLWITAINFKVFLISNSKQEYLLYSVSGDISSVLEDYILLGRFTNHLPKLFEVNEDTGYIITELPVGMRGDKFFEENFEKVTDSINEFKFQLQNNNLSVDLSPENLIINGSDFYIIDFTVLKNR